MFSGPVQHNQKSAMFPQAKDLTAVEIEREQSEPARLLRSSAPVQSASALLRDGSEHLHNFHRL